MEPKLLTAERFVDSCTGISYRYVYSDTEYFRPHYHDYYEIFLLLEGKADHIVNGTRFPLSAGTLVFIRPRDTHDYLPQNGKPFSMLNITFTQKTCDELFSYLGDGFCCDLLRDTAFPPEVQLSETGFSYILAQMTNIRTIDASDAARVRTALRILLFRIFTRFFADFTEEEEREMPLWLSDLCAQMRKNGNFTHGIERMLALCDKSREHISRSMKKYTGQTLSEFINDLRLKFIANMLQNSNHDIADIIFESGFGNISWATELFRKKYGVTMSQYRKKA